MLNIYPTTLLLARAAALAATAIQRHDKDLAQQLRRSGASVPLNTAEGAGGRGGTRTARYADALGSAYEVRATLETACAMGYLAPPDHDTLDRIDHVIAVLYKLTH